VTAYIVFATLFLPLLLAPTLLYTTKNARDYLSYFYIFIIISLSLLFFSSQLFSSIETIQLNFYHIFHTIFILIDFALLLYFLMQGWKKSDKRVALLAIVQLIFYTVLLQSTPLQNSSDILIDRVSLFMILVVNVIGGIIIIYALKYIESEAFERRKRNLFIVILFVFLSVMNLIVTTNNLEVFFLAFELTTLCSYLLIRYRGDATSNTNALVALWMNQIGGVAILIALLLSLHSYDTLYLDILLRSVDANYLLPVALLVLAAFVKGASIPFDKWLLGAMVAPTPVSAILHSATMVKIAPYLILKIAPSFSPALSMLVMLFGSFVFMSASLLALSKDYFKEILGLSTIALLAFMMAIASIGTKEAIDIALILIVFHAISKALLFLQAGILEKEFQLKYLKDISYLAKRSKLVVFFILIGFASLALPPFGAFIGKFSSIELIASMIDENILYLFSLIFILMGSVFLTLLYFKVVTKLLPSDSIISQGQQKIATTYQLTSWSLVLLLVFGVFVSAYYGYMSMTQIVLPTTLVLVTLLLFYLSNFSTAQRSKEYNCGERDSVELGAYYFDISSKYKSLIFYSSIGLILMILIVGV